ncbi:uncharacterized protein [Dendropsophus ebraccatus]|uniref:uncharacterized protein isoform X3 n=1 Tax=Dendropsophus ebraccatus TaxID=150705 RepID=UPI003832142F
MKAIIVLLLGVFSGFFVVARGSRIIWDSSVPGQPIDPPDLDELISGVRPIRFWRVGNVDVKVLTAAGEALQTPTDVAQESGIIWDSSVPGESWRIDPIDPIDPDEQISGLCPIQFWSVGDDKVLTTAGEALKTPTVVALGYRIIVEPIFRIFSQVIKTDISPIQSERDEDVDDNKVLPTPAGILQTTGG